jgi:uncharacterized protein involved in exopolysaccharide biosynthesis
MVNNEIVNWKEIIKSVIEKKYIILSIIIVTSCFSLLLAFIVPPKYESKALVQTRSLEKETKGAGLGSLIGRTSIENSPTNYIALMKSRRVVEPIVEELEWDKENKPDVESFAKDRLLIENIKSTNLISVTAYGRSPEEAQRISHDVVENFLVMQTDNNKQTQSLLVQFLTERIADAKQEADEASQKFAEYQKEHKLYSPSERASTVTKKFSLIDDKIKDVKVKEASASAQLDAINSKLGEIGTESKRYAINDNEIVQSIRKEIVNQQIELIDLENKYTDNYPDVIAVHKKINALHDKLIEEVNDTVDSNAVTLNPAQANLLQSKMKAEVELSVDNATYEALIKKRKEIENETNDLPTELIDYAKLEREAKIKNDIYVNLVKQCEKDRIEEAKQSMDIQIIDPASLPEEKKPIFPKKKMFLLVGILLGVIISVGYLLMSYFKKGLI